MKTLLRLLPVFFATTAATLAAPLTSTTAVHTKPDEASPTITVLSPGTEPVPTLGATMANTPPGWMAVELAGPFDAYVQNRDLAKSLDVRDGASIYLAPKSNSGVLTVKEKGDQSSITGLHGSWTQISLQKTVTGYIRVQGAASYTTAPASQATQGAPPVSPAPMTPVAYGVTTAGRPAPMVNLGDGGSSTLPRLFQGKFVSTRSAFKPRRPFDWALDDDGGSRYAYLDMSKLLLTEQLDKYIDRHVVVYGAAKSVTGGKDIVIVVESLQLK
jgi:hypothetical protein